MKFILFFVLVLNLSNIVLTLDKKKDCKCRISSSSKIVQGRNSIPGSHPWHVSLQFKLEPWGYASSFLSKEEQKKVADFFCMGTIINEWYIATAAHCVYEIKQNQADTNIKVGYGHTSMQDMFDEDSFVGVESIIISENYVHPNNVHSNQVFNDIALLKLKTPLNFNENTQPVCILEDFMENYSSLMVVGYGAPNVISGLEIPIEGTDQKFEWQSEPLIQLNLKELEVIDESNSFNGCEGEAKQKVICGFGRDGGSPCINDSGAPLIETINGKSYLVGIANWSEKIWSDETKYEMCTGRSAYTRLSKYMDFIRNNINDNYCT